MKYFLNRVVHLKKKMKYNKLIFLTLSIAITLSSCNFYPSKPEVKVVSPSPQSQANTLEVTRASDPILAGYMAIKNAMVADDSLSVSLAIETLHSSIKERIKNSKQSTDNALYVKMESLALEMKNQNFEQQRMSLIDLTAALLDWNKSNPSAEKIYLQYCPMYQGGNYWLSMNEQVLNPYYGSKMLRCGVVEKVLN